ncbi:unnamed protein product [Penicillium manginii]
MELCGRQKVVQRKMVLLGDGACGKTSALNVFTRGCATPHLPSPSPLNPLKPLRPLPELPLRSLQVEVEVRYGCNE